MKRCFFVSLFTFYSLVSNAQLSPTNGPLAGTITCFDSLGGKIFAGTSWGAIYKSMDSGNTWSMTYGNSGVTRIYSFAILDTEILAATSAGVIMSVDSGNTWLGTGLLLGPAAYSITTVGSKIFVGTNEGVFLSTDNGGSWVEKNIPGTSSLCPTPTVAISDTTLFACTIFGSYRSTDYGNTWTVMNTGLPASAYFNSIINSGSNIYGGSSGMSLSVDNGDNWTAIDSGLTDLFVKSAATDGANIFAATGNGGVFLSTNSGSNWTSVNNGLQSLKMQSVFTNGINVFAGAENGLYLSANNGTTWAISSMGLASTEVTCLAGYGNKLFAGTGKGVFVSTDNGNVWNVVNNGLPVGSWISDIKIIDTTIFVIAAGSVYRSTDNGLNWFSASTGLSEAWQINSLTVNGTNLYLSAGSGLYISSDYGNTWSLVYTSSYIIFGKMIFKGTTMFACQEIGYSGGVYSSIDSGNSWNVVSGFSLSYVYDMVVFGNDIYIGGNGAYGDLWKSSDDGASWISLGTLEGFPPIDYATSLAIDSSNIYVGFTNGEIHFSDDSGSHWNLLGACNSAINSIKIKGTTIFAGSDREGVWKGKTRNKVWPGDANNDSIVNNEDLLPIGLFYGQTGISRDSISNVWQADRAVNWGILETNESDIKHADCNGDGIIDDNDTLAVNLNFSLMHAISAIHNETKVSLPEIYFVTDASSYGPGQTVDAEIWMGTSADPVSDLYGISLNVGYNSSFVEPGTEIINYSAGWLGDPETNAIKISKADPLANTVYGAIVRTDHINASGYGKIADFKFKLKSLIATTDSMHFYINDYTAVNAAGTPLSFHDVPLTVQITAGTTNIHEKNNINGINIYPNPYSESTQISYSITHKSIVTVEVYNAMGVKVETLANAEQQSGDYKYTFSAKQKGYDAGIYFVKISVDGNVSLKKIVEMK